MANIDISVILKARDEASGALQKLGGQIGKTGREFGNLRRDVAVAGVAIAGLGATIGTFARQAARLDLITDAFNTMTRDIDVSADELVKSVQDATSGIISEYDVLQKANLALNLIGKDTFTDFGTQYEELAVIASKAAQATGESAEFMFDSIVRGIGRASPLILDNLGLSIKLGEAYEKYAQTLGKSADELTATEQKQALLNEVVDQGNVKYGEIDIASENFAVRLQQMQVRLAELGVEIGEKLLPTIENLITKFTNLDPRVQKAIVLGGILIPIIVALGTVIGALIGIVTALGAAFSAAGTVLTIVIGIIGGPATAAVLAITALVGAFYLAWRNNWFGVRDITDRVVGFLIDKFNAVKNVIESVANAISNVVRRAKEMANAVAGGLHIPGFQHGGVVPGPVGAPVLATVHGGEEITPPSRTRLSGGGGGLTINVSVPFFAGTETEKRNIGRDLYQALVREAASKNMSVAEMLGG